MKQALRHFALALAVTALFAILAAAARAGDDVPRGPVEEAYAITVKTLTAKGKAPPPPWRPPPRDKLLSESLAALVARADHFLNGQDGEVKMLSLDTIPVAACKATVIASFRSFGKPVAVQFRMIRENGGWRIDDIVNSFEGKDYSVREVLSQPYDCGSFMGKPCKR